MKKAVYIFSSGNVKRDENTIFVDTDKTRKYIPIENTSEIYAFGELSFNTKLLNYLSEKEIILHYFNYYGYYSGTIYPRQHLSSGYVIINQVKHYLDISKRLEIAKLIEYGSSGNMLVNLKYYDNRGINLSDKIQKIDNLKNEFNKQNNINSLMLIEGKIRKFYYSAFSYIIKNSDFKLETRNKRPPKDRINALISFINSIIYTKVLSEIYKTHMDPRIGYLHETNFRRFTLNLDIAEGFKPILGDRTIFKLLNENIITSNDFINYDNMISLKENGRKEIMKQLDEKLSTTIKYPGLSHNVSYQRLIRLEIYKLEKHIMGDEYYKPYISKW